MRRLTQILQPFVAHQSNSWDSLHSDVQIDSEILQKVCDHKSSQSQLTAECGSVVVRCRCCASIAAVSPVAAAVAASMAAGFTLKLRINAGFLISPLPPPNSMIRHPIDRLPAVTGKASAAKVFLFKQFVAAGHSGVALTAVPPSD